MNRPTYRLAIDGDDCGETSLGEFYDLNHEEGGSIDDVTHEALCALVVGETYSDGGGASPTWTLTRIS